VLRVRRFASLRGFRWPTIPPVASAYRLRILRSKSDGVRSACRQSASPGVRFRCWSGGVRLSLAGGSAAFRSFAALRAVPTFELPLVATGHPALSEPYGRSAPRADLGPGSSLLRVVLHAHFPALSDVVSAPCVVSCSGRSTSTAPPAGTGFRQGQGAFSSCGFVVGGVMSGWGSVLAGPSASEPGTRPQAQAADGFRGWWCCASPLLRLRRNPGAGDLPGKDRPPTSENTCPLRSTHPPRRAQLTGSG
jgi:hypothetical protein